MWEIVARIVVEKLEETATSTAERIEVFSVPAGRIPSRSQLINMAQQRAREFFTFVSDTRGNRPYDYGEILSTQILSVTWVPR